MFYKILFIFTYLIISITDCKKKDWRDDMPTIDYKLLHKESLAKKGLTITLDGGFSDRDIVISEWIKAKKANLSASDDSYILTEKEYSEFFLPYTLGEGTSLDVTPLQTYWPMFLERRTYGLQKLRETLIRSNGKIKKFNWRPEVRNYGPWRAWKLDSIIMSSKSSGEDISIEEIKLVACYLEKCKIAVIAP
jgi:hypothetical protein